MFPVDLPPLSRRGVALFFVANCNWLCYGINIIVIRNQESMDLQTMTILLGSIFLLQILKAGNSSLCRIGELRIVRASLCRLGEHGSRHCQIFFVQTGRGIGFVCFFVQAGRGIGTDNYRVQLLRRLCAG